MIAPALTLLLEQGLVHEADLLTPSFRIENMGGRNRSQLVSTASMAFLVKIFATPELAEREAAALNWFIGSSGEGFLIPRVRRLERELLITETPRGLQSLAANVQSDRYPRAVLRRLGLSLARLHSMDPPSGTPPVEILPVEVDGASLPVLNESPGVRATLEEIYADELLLRAVQALVEQPPCKCSAIHGDIRAANILRRMVRTSSPDLYLIDWETAGVGDPMRDVGAAIAQILTLSMHAYTAGPDRAGIRVFLDAYRAAGGTLHLGQAIQRAGVSLVQQSIEVAARADSIPGLARTSLRIARIALLAPESFAVQLQLVS